MSVDVVVLGSLHLDMIVDAPRLPERGETLPGTAWRWACGGKGGNQAVAAAAFGARTAMVGRVGADDLGARLRANLEAAGVETSGVMIDPGAGTGMSVAISEAAGDYAAVIVSGVNLRIDARDAERAAAALRPGGVLLLQNEIPEPANLAAATAARRAGARVVLNAAPARAFATGLTSAVDLLVVNAVEARMLAADAGSGPAEGADALAARLGIDVLVTVGGDGLVLARPGAQRLAVPGHRVNVVSTHGAGDVLVGVLAARVAAGDPLERAVGTANTAAAWLVAQPVTMRRAPRPADLSPHPLTGD